MKKSRIISACFFLFLFMVSCKSPQKLYEKGDYDGSIRLAVDRLRKKNVDEDDVKTLVEAFNYINSREADKLTRLRAEQRTDEKWREIYDLANKIRTRQDLVKPLTDFDDQKYYGHLADLKFTNVDYAISESRDGAAEAFYKKGVENLTKARNGERLRARDAFNEFSNISNYYSTYKDVVTLKEEATRLGINHVFFTVLNDSRVLLPPDFDKGLKSLFVRDLNTQWVKYHTFKEENLRYEYDIVARITRIDIGPDALDRSQHIEEAQVEDGFENTYDENGKIKKDTAGNEIKVAKFKKVRADVFEVNQHKEARVFGYLEYFDNRTKEKVLSTPMESTAVFNHNATRFEGDRRALSKETQRRLGGSTVPFPNDEEILMLASETMKSRAKSIIDENNYIVIK
jgi:hypothetical protein